MLKEAIFHTNDIPYLFSVSENEVKLRIRTKRDEIASCIVVHSDRYVAPGNGTALHLNKVASTVLHDYFETIIYTKVRRLRYQFLLTDLQGAQVWYGEYMVSESREAAGYFHCPNIANADDGSPPSWVKDAIVYQIFPERFNNGNQAINPSQTRSWTSNEPLEYCSFYGGDLQGIIEKLPYLHMLGVNVVYLNPVFESPTNHKYDTTDYYKIDPHFGDLNTMKELVRIAHSLQIRVVLDAVFNHAGDQSAEFQDVVAHGENSRYKDWFHIASFPIVQSPIPNYEAFGMNTPSMPKLNTRNPEVIEYLIAVAKYWIHEVGIDGWRLDVANEVDHAFWRRLRQEIKSIDRELLLVGEVMHRSGSWLRGDQFDGVMNYILRDVMVDFFAKQTITVRMFMDRVDEIRMEYTDYAQDAMFNLLGSHDTLRFLTACSKSVWGWHDKYEQSRMMLAVLFQFSYTGMPVIYYGDEVGMTGGEDPDCRKPMVWQESEQNKELFAYYQSLITVRKTNIALREGEYQRWFVNEAMNTWGIIRSHPQQTIGILFNNSPNVSPIEIAELNNINVKSIQQLFGSAKLCLENGTIVGELPPYSGTVITLY
ncbi:MAG: glycoside hydrolase family 13 protein [Candidatus Cohnella colombiensis]|uniref:Glycoside hydrolase family 13 protein n=1 Tax=Candidatus Cohnella colombiensis TaxID=3121368 RepID=A0AA95EX99_9BACL|nr:MAG: glycoside hydrolase family 13 protein [Cohnella sp.]